MKSEQEINSLEKNQEMPGKKKPAKWKLAILQVAMALLLAASLVLVLLVLILPLFRVKTLEVQGNTYYSQEEIIEVSGIVAGEELMAIDGDSVCERIFKKCDYVQKIRIEKKITGKVIIRITESQAVAYARLPDGVYTLSADLTVLKKCADAREYEALPEWQLPEVSSVSVGERLLFSGSDADFSYPDEVLSQLFKWKYYSAIVSVDLRTSSRISCTFASKFTVFFGKSDRLEEKILCADLLIEKNASHMMGGEKIDVSDPSAPIFSAS